MAPIDSIDSPRARTIVIVLMLISLGICTLTMGSTYFYDSACRAGANNWLPVYPNSILVQESYSFLTMHGIGVTQREFYSPDDYLEVRRWYQEQNTIAGREHKTRGGSAMDYRAVEAEDGGTQIRLISECAKELDLSELGIGGGSQRGEAS